jgi:hypothetical protein
MPLKKKKYKEIPGSIQNPDLYSMDQSDRSSPDLYHDERDKVKTDDDKVKLVMSQLRKSVNARALYIDPLARQISKQYFAFKRQLKEKDRKRANIRVWHSFKQVESMVPAIYDFVVSGDNPIRCTSLGDEDPDQEAAIANQNLLSYQYLFQCTPKLKMYLAIKNNSMFGMSPVKIFWDHKKGYAFTREEIIQGGKVVGLKRTKSLVTKAQHPNFEPYGLENFYWDPSASRIEDAKWCLFISTISMRDLYLNKKTKEGGVYFNLDKITPRPPMNRSQGIITAQNNYFDVIRGDKSGPKNLLFGDYNYEVEVIEYWEEDRVLTIANGSVLCRDSDTPFDHGMLPAIVMKHIPIMDQMMGVGVIEPIIDLDKEANLKRNQRIDNVNLSMNAMWAVKKGAQAWPKSMASAPGRTIPVDTIEDIKPIIMPDVTVGAYNEERGCVSDMDVTNGNFPDVTRGEQSERKEQATVYVGRSRAANNRIGMVGIVVQESFVSMMRMFHFLNKQFMPNGTPYLILGNPGGKIKSARVNRNHLFVELEFAIGDVGFWGNKEIEFGRISQILPVLLQSPRIDQDKMLTDIFRSMGVKDPYRWIKPPENPTYNMSDPRQENFIMYKTGRMIDVSPLDNQVQHHLYHKLFIDGADPESIPEFIIDLVRQHDAMHVQQIQQSRMMAMNPRGAGPGGMLTNTAPIPSGQVPIQNEMSMAQNAGNAASAGAVGSM